MTSTARPVRHVLAAAGALALSTLALALPAQAEVILHEKFDDSFSEDFEECGMPLHSDFAFRGTTHLRVGKGDLESAFLLHLTIQRTDTITNPANGKFFVIEGNVLERDVHVSRVEGSTFEFTRVESGQPFVVRDMNGDVVLRDRGSIWFTALFDTLGDDTPGGEFVTDFDVIRINGPHPGFFLDDDQFCGLVKDLIG
jgi:hypothetical protein